MEQNQHLKWLHESLNQRKRPEDVADVILTFLDGRLNRKERRTLEGAAKNSLRKMVWNYTSMLEDFIRPVGMQRQVATAEDIFESAYHLQPDECDDPEHVRKLIQHLGREIGKYFGLSDFQANRLNREEREHLGLDISRRRYNKLFRHLQRMERKLETLSREQQKLRFTLIGKSGLVHELSYDEIASDPDGACFIAYYTARCNLRSEFTIFGQQRPYDKVADMLFARCRERREVNWWAIAHAYPAQEVLKRLSDKEKGLLLGQWFGVLQSVGDMLREVWEDSNINRATMIVRRGNDSSTWNNTASAWNKARSHWISLLYAMGMEGMLKAICMGKVLRLMAADVVAWHRNEGGDLDADTFVWNALPLPWEVLSGECICTIDMIGEACRRYGVDPIKSGWIGPRPAHRPVEFRPTPELVHGVSVANPFLASALRDRGFFSGKGAASVTGSIEEAELHADVARDHQKRLRGDQEKRNHSS